jgi:hypothetical protein
MLHPDAVFWPIHGIAIRSMTPGLWEEMAIQAATVVASTPNAVSAVAERTPGSLVALSDNTSCWTTTYSPCRSSCRMSPAPLSRRIPC